MRSNLPTEKKLNTLVKKSVDLKPLQILGWKGIKSKNTAILTLKYPSWEQKVRRPRVKKSGDKKSGKTSNLQGKLVFVQKWGRRTFSMEIGWFWGEIRVLWWRQLINTAVGHYLWGIDTNQCRCFSQYPNQFYHSTCRTLPMRNWYLLPLEDVHLWPEPQTEVGHYLWGIDTFAVILLICVFIKKSDITYEELILMTMLIFELHLHRRTLPMRNWYFFIRHSQTIHFFSMSDITYEELILCLYT